MPTLYRVTVEDARPHYTARKRDALKLAREWSLGGVWVGVEVVEVARLPLLDLLAAALNGGEWSDGDGLVIAGVVNGMATHVEAPPKAAAPLPGPPIRERVRQPVQVAPRIRERVRT